MQVGGRVESVEPNCLTGWSTAKSYRGPVRHSVFEYPTRERHEAFGALLFVSFLCGLLLLLKSSARAQVQPIRRVLILNEAGTAYPGINLVDQGLRTALDNSPYK